MAWILMSRKIGQWQEQQPHERECATHDCVWINFRFVASPIARTGNAIRHRCCVGRHAFCWMAWHHRRYRFSSTNETERSRASPMNFVFFWSVVESFAVQWSAQNASNAHSNHAMCRSINVFSLSHCDLWIVNRVCQPALPTFCWWICQHHPTCAFNRIEMTFWHLHREFHDINIQSDWWHFISFYC